MQTVAQEDHREATHPTPTDQEPHHGYVTAPAGVHPDTYALLINGSRLAPDIEDGDIVIVEPIPPLAGDYAVLFRVGAKLPGVFRMAPTFNPRFLNFHPDSECFPMIEFEDAAKRYWLEARQLERVHRVHSVIRAADRAKAAGDTAA